MDLFDRVEKGDLDYIKTVKPDVLLKARGKDGVSVLSVATTNDQLDCCKEILEKCPSLLYHQSDQKNTVLHVATYSKSGIYRLIDFFVSFALDKATTSEGENMVRFKRWIKLQNHNEDTALTQAAYYRHLHIVKRLVDVDRQHKLGLSEIHGYQGKTALQLAVEYQDQEMIKLLTDDGEGDPYSNYIPLSISMDLFDHVKYGDMEYIKTVELDVLLNSRDEERNSVLLIATKYDQLDCCEEILKRCPSLLYHQTNCKDTVLHYATYYKSGIPRLIDFFVTVGLDAAANEGENMLRFKKWMRMQNNYSDTALTQAAYYQNLHIVKMLVEVDSQYKLGLSEIVGYKSKTALLLALEYQDREMIKLLTDKGDPSSKIVPLSIVKDLFARVKYGDLDYIKTVELDVLLNSRDEGRLSVLSVATQHDQLDCCKEILKRCPLLLYHQTKQKNTVLHDASYYKKNGISRLIDLFVTAGLDAATSEGDVEGENMIRFKRWIKSQNHNGDTALTQAAYYRNLHIVKTMVEVDRQHKLGLSEIHGDQGKTALQLAVEYQDQEMIKLLTDDGEGDAYSNYIPLSISMDLFDHVKYGDLEYIKTVELDVLLNSRDEERNSVLLIATTYDQLDCCEEILKRCPSLLYHQTNSKETVLHYATYYKSGIPRLIDFFVNVGLDAATNEGNVDNKEGENMIRFKKWIKLQNHNADTALTQASYYRNHDIVKIFVEVDRQYKLGLSEIVGYSQKTALQLALEYQDHEMIKLLTDSRDPDFDYGANNGGNMQISIAIEQAQESLPTGNSSGTGVVSENKIFSSAEVSKHNNSKDCWLVINDKVYDVTGFLGDHPGGGEILLKATGKDATRDFNEVHSHSSNAMTMMDKFYVGVYDSITSLLIKLASDKPQPYSYEQLVDFTKNFSVPLGSGGFGDVYKGKFPNGVLIAVKVLKDNGKEKIMEEQFAAEVETMGRTYHRNLIRLYGYCYGVHTKFKALIYDYMESGSFDTVLFEKKLDLPWEKLHNIAKEVAQGISYLHESCYPQIIHQDIKPANVLLDSNLSPKVIDFGLAKVNMGESQFEQTKVKGTRNYMAPEVNQPNQVRLSCKCDVYSFGMMLFDILGSKRNHVDKRFWFPGQVWDKFNTNQLDKFILDCGIKEEDKDSAKRLSVVALLCVEHNPVARPMMSTVVKMLEGKIKQLDTPTTPFYPNYYSSSESSSVSDSREF
ncbi:hypothetical protein AQUCO_01000591v1 [Aquilegia coerulea]|uniref:non-specific serine/threonine protein kinase n=1 Tax=Aquilegia coerulea TaxID=218851 RepID=A0A2G5EAQ3_AQUCA|nr:hypothetical protein AQUCO_01000591v1 [Aquilegia coerulea]